MKIYSLIALVVWVIHSSANGQLKVPGLDNFRKVMANSSIDYSMKCTYPGGRVYDINGTMATQGNNFYDSSNLRYVLLNDEWYIIADHLLKEVSVAYIKEINKELEGIASVTASTFLFDEDFFLGISEVKITRQNQDTTWISLDFKDTTMIRSLNVTALRKDMKPVQYSAVIYYPIGGYEDEESVTVRLEMECFNIKAPANSALFDDKRLVSKNGKKVTLKKFNTYKTYN